MPAQLVALSDGPSILLDKPILLLGRHPECDIQVYSRKVSRRHCIIAQVSDYLVVRDLGSTNGIRINGVRTVEGRLKAGDQLTIGHHNYRVQWDSQAAAAQSIIGRSPVEEPARPAAPLRKTADDYLEECEEPVPLPEEIGVVAPQSPPLDIPAVQPTPATRHRPATRNDVLHSEPTPSLIIPEDLDLAPPSDEAQAPSTP